MLASGRTLFTSGHNEPALNRWRPTLSGRHRRLPDVRSRNGEHERGEVFSLGGHEAAGGEAADLGRPVSHRWTDEPGQVGGLALPALLGPRSVVRR